MPKGFKRTPRFLIEERRRRSAFSSSAGAAGWPGSLVTPSISGITVTPQTALSYSAYYAGVRVISEDVSSLPIAVFQRRPKGGAKLVRKHPITVRFGRCPAGESNEMTSLQWREAWTAHALGWGNGYAEIDWSKGGEFLGLELLHPQTTKPQRKDQPDARTGRRALYYELDGIAGALREGRPKTLPPHRVLHLAGLGFNGLIGYSPVGLLREAIGLGKAAEQFGASLFGNGAMPKGFLKYPGKLRKEAKDNLRDSWNAVHQGSANANKVAVLEEGMDWVNTQINPDDAQFLLTRQFQVIEICRMLRLPPHKLQDYSQAHLANIEASNLDYLMTTLRPWCIRIEQCLDLKLLTDEEYAAGFYCRHDIRSLLRASIKDRAEFYQKMFQFGMSPNEIFELEDMNPIPDEAGGNKRFRPGNMVELDSEAPETDPSQIPGDPGEPGRPEGSSLEIRRNGVVLPSKNGHFTHENGVI